MDSFRSRRREKPNRERHQTETDETLPNNRRHAGEILNEQILLLFVWKRQR
jgi:hypothetical protein